MVWARERMDEYRMARRVMTAEVEGGYEVDRGLDGWCEAGLGQQRNEGGGCASIRERSKRAESPGAQVTE